MKNRTEFTHYILPILFLAGLFFAAIHSTFAATEAIYYTIDVTTTSDEFGTGANCSVREAVQSSNTGTDFGGCVRDLHIGSPSPDVILVPNAVYNLTRNGFSEDANATGDLDITASVVMSSTNSVPTIRGEGGWDDRVLHILGETATVKRINLGFGNTLNNVAGGGVRIEVGAAADLQRLTVGNNTAGGNAGGILNQGTLSLTDSTVDSNTADGSTGGGGIYSSPNSTLTIVNSTISNNEAANGSGGGIYVDDGATVVMSFSSISTNSADASGGGLYSDSSLLTIENTVFNGNLIPGFGGGGGLAIILGTGNTPAVIRNSVFRDNSIDGDGGGIFTSAPMLILNSTLHGNSADRTLGVGGEGGGIAIEGGSITSIVNTTISNNETQNDGGGIYVDDTSTLNLSNSTVSNNTSNSDGLSGGDGGGLFAPFNGTANLRNSVLANNLQNGIGDSDDCAGSYTNFSFDTNLLENSTCSFSGSGNDIYDIDPALLALGNNGGPLVGRNASEPLLTSGFFATSALTDAGNNNSGCKDHEGNLLTEDERGFARPIGFACDIGAFEFGSTGTATPTPTITPGGSTLTPTPTLTITPGGPTLTPTPTPISISDQYVFLPIIVR